MWILLGSLTVVRNGYSLRSVKIDKGSSAIVSSTSFGLEKELFEGSKCYRLPSNGFTNHAADGYRAEVKRTTNSLSDSGVVETSLCG